VGHITTASSWAQFLLRSTSRLDSAIRSAATPITLLCTGGASDSLLTLFLAKPNRTRVVVGRVSGCPAEYEPMADALGASLHNGYAGCRDRDMLRIYIYITLGHTKCHVL